jgi:plastocyanin
VKGSPVKRLVPVLALALAVAFPLGAPAAKHAAAGTAGAMSPAGVTCTAGDPVVWVNTETKVYHMAGTTYYGKTKHGKYACASDATKMGAHAAKRESGNGGSPGGGSMGGTMGGSTTSSSTSAGSTGPGSSSGGKHHRHRGGSMMSPMPAPSPT